MPEWWAFPGNKTQAIPFRAVREALPIWLGKSPQEAAAVVGKCNRPFRTRADHVASGDAPMRRRNSGKIGDGAWRKRESMAFGLMFSFPGDGDPSPGILQYRQMFAYPAIPTCSGSAVMRGLTSSAERRSGLDCRGWDLDMEEKKNKNRGQLDGGNGRQRREWCVSSPRGDPRDGSWRFKISERAQRGRSRRALADKTLSSTVTALLASFPDICAGNRVGVKRFEVGLAGIRDGLQRWQVA